MYQLGLDHTNGIHPVSDQLPHLEAAPHHHINHGGKDRDRNQNTQNGGYHMENAFNTQYGRGSTGNHEVGVQGWTIVANWIIMTDQ